MSVNTDLLHEFALVCERLIWFCQRLPVINWWQPT